MGGPLPLAATTVASHCAAPEADELDTITDSK
jgi:hypothetical protein